MERRGTPPHESTDRAGTLVRRRVVLMIGVYTFVFSVYTLLRYYSFKTLFFDLGVFTYSMNQVLHGAQGLQTLLLPSTPGHVGHFSPILVLPLAVYALLPSPATLLVFQTLVLGLAALPLFELALAVLRKTNLAVAIVVAFLLYPALQGVNRYDFHTESFVPLLGFGALLMLVRQQYRGFVVVSICLLCVHEYLSILFLWTGGVVLLYQLLSGKDRVLGLVGRAWSATTAGLGALFFAVENVVSIVLTPSHQSILSWLDLTSSTFTGGVGNLLGGVGVDPGLKLLFWALLLVPLLLLPLRELPLTLPVVPWLGLTILASNQGIYSIYTQYSAFVLPFLFFAVMGALRRRNPLGSRRLSAQRLGAALVVAGLAATALAGPLSPLNPYDGMLSNGFAPPYPPLVTAHDHATAALLGLVPENATVLAQNELFSQLSDRTRVSITWNTATDGFPQYIAVDTQRTWFTSPVPPSQTALSALVPQILANASYGVAGFSGSTFVYELGDAANPGLTATLAALPDSPAALSQGWTVENATAAAGPSGVSLWPTPGAQGIAWTSVPSADGVFVTCRLAWSSVSNSSWSGLAFGAEGALGLQIVAVRPLAGELVYMHRDDGVFVETVLGNQSVGAGYANLDVLVSGGALQVWFGGRFLRFLGGLPTAPIGALGVVSFGQNLTVSSFEAYRSIADQPPFTNGLPWDGVAVFVGLVVPVVAILFIKPGVDWWFQAIRRGFRKRK